MCGSLLASLLGHRVALLCWWPVAGKSLRGGHPVAKQLASVGLPAEAFASPSGAQLPFEAQ